MQEMPVIVIHTTTIWTLKNFHKFLYVRVNCEMCFIFGLNNQIIKTFSKWTFFMACLTVKRPHTRGAGFREFLNETVSR